MRLLASAITALLLLASTASADEAEDAAAGEPHRRYGGGLELGAMGSRADGPRRDMVPLFSFRPEVTWILSARWSVGVGLAIPVPPGLAVQLPVAATYRPLGGPHGLAIRGGVRPLFALVDLCAGEPAACPMEQALAEPRDGGGWIFGAAGELGVYYEGGVSSRVLLHVGLSYLAGAFRGRAKHAETPLDGLYQGGVFWLGISTR